MAHVQVIVDDQPLPAGLETALRRVGASASFGSAHDALRTGLPQRADAVVVVAPRAAAKRPYMVSLLRKLAIRPRATLVLHAEGETPPADLDDESLPVSFSTRTDPDDLAARLATLISVGRVLERRASSATAAHPAENAVVELYRSQLELAARVQNELLGPRLQRCGDFDVRVLYRPLEFVSGDVYDVRLIGADHLAFGLADVQGHGISAALLTVYIKRAWRIATTSDGDIDSLPARVLERVNQELLDTELKDHGFASAVYGLLELSSGRAVVARAGSPYPILRRADGSCELLAPRGPLAGLSGAARFEVAVCQVGRGDALLVYSDGLDLLTLGAAAYRRCAECPDRAITATPWYRLLGESGVAPALEHLEQRYDTLRRLGRELDDLTVLTISRRGWRADRAREDSNLQPSDSKSATLSN